MLFGRFEFTTDLQYKVKHLQHQVDAFESGEKYAKMNSNFQAMLIEKSREVKTLRNELADSRSETVTARKNWMQVFEDLHAEYTTAIHNAERINKALEERALKAERRVDALKDENLALKRERYAIQTELEEERAKTQKLLSQIKKTHENSSIPSSMKPNHTPITNNREKSGKTPGGQFGHKGHGRKKQNPSEVIEIPPPSEYADNPDYEPTGRIIKRQRVGIRVLPYTEEYITLEFRNIKTGKLVYAEFPAGVENDVNYDGSVKAFAFLLNNHCNVSMDKTSEFLSEVTDGALQISKGMVCGLSREFSEKSKAEQAEAFSNLVVAPVLHLDFTTAKVNGKNVNVAVCATPQNAVYFAREHKGHKGIKDTPAELNPNTHVHDHDKTFYSYGRLHQECLVHILRYLLDSMQNEKNRTWSTLMRDLMREMIHYRNRLGPEEDLDPVKVTGFEERFGEILDIADQEYDYEPPGKYYKDGFNLKKRLREFREAHLLFLHDKNVPENNNLAERLLRVFKRKQRQVMSFRSFNTLDYLCKSLTMFAQMRSRKVNVYKSVSDIFG
jgi:nitroimidazol reductase NimA-like FMN-containing flavoprotein (pyridoxamine 5'-phosphate oxidase superfamily)